MTPQELSRHVRIGGFKGSEIMDSHDFGGTLWDQLDGAMERFRRILQVTTNWSGGRDSVMESGRTFDGLPLDRRPLARRCSEIPPT